MMKNSATSLAHLLQDVHHNQIGSLHLAHCWSNYQRDGVRLAAMSCESHTMHTAHQSSLNTMLSILTRTSFNLASSCSFLVSSERMPGKSTRIRSGTSFQVTRT